MDDKASLEKKIEELKKKIELNPDWSLGYYPLGDLYIDLKEYHKSIKVFQKVIEINPYDDIAYSYMGIAYGKLKEYSKAQECYKKAQMIQEQDKEGIKVANKTKKIKKISISDYRMFKDFEIDFTDKDGKSLNIIVIAGENGTGKTTLFELLEKDSVEPNKVVYLPAYKENIEDLKANIIQKYINKASKLNDFNEALKELNEFINDVFEGLKFNFTISKIDNEEKSVRFTNSANDEFEIEALSTGEKTLLSKVLFLYFKDYKEKIILIDEPEISLHPSWQNHILKIYENFAKKYDSQVIIATHSPQIIGSAKPESLRILNKRKDGKIEVVDNRLAYGRDIEWVLEEVMGANFTREQSINKKFDEAWELINEEKYEEAEQAIDNIEQIIGANDSEILKLRNELFFERTDFEEN